MFTWMLMQQTNAGTWKRIALPAMLDHDSPEEEAITAAIAIADRTLHRVTLLACDPEGVYTVAIARPRRPVIRYTCTGSTDTSN